MKLINILAVLIVCLFLTACAPTNGTSLFGEDTVSKEDRSAWVLSQRSTDPSICDGITTSTAFQDGCYENIAINIKNPSLCDKINGDPDYCKSDYADETGDSSVCATLSTENVRSSCFSRIAKSSHNPDLCAKVERTKTCDDCYWELSFGSDDPCHL